MSHGQPSIGELARRLELGPPLLLDGATGTELERRGTAVELPLWSARALLEAPDVVARIHADYVAAGAEIITANTFRTQRRTLARRGLGEHAGELTSLAVELARGAAAGGSLVAGSAPTLEDCYRPDLVPEPAVLAAEHQEHAEQLAAAGADLILVETMNTQREAVAAVRAARRVGLPVLVSFVCWDGPRLLSGEPLAEALAAVADDEPLGVLVNCLPPSNVAPCLPVLRASDRPYGVYANLGAPDASGFARSEDCSPAQWADLVSHWLEAGVDLVGGCCGTTPAHIAATAARIRDPASAG